MRINTQEVINNHDIVDVISRYIEVKKTGSDYSAICPFHDETTPSFTISKSKRFFHCFGCGAHGDVIKFVQEYRGVDFKEAVNEITNGNPPTTYETPTKRTFDHVEEVKEWQPIVPVPEHAGEPPRTFSKKIKDKWVPCDFIHQWEYKDASGVIGYVNRFELNGKKDYLPVTYCRNVNTGEVKWKYQAFPKPRPVYNWSDLIAKPNAIVAIHEGEKKVDAFNRMMPTMASISWAGGSKAVKHTNFKNLADRNVLIFRDNDLAGLEAAETLAATLLELNCKVKIIEPPENAPESWDMWDAEKEGWTTDRIVAHIRTNAREPLAFAQPEPEIMPERPPEYEYDRDAFPDIKGGYRPLGYDHGRYYYLSGNGCQVIELAATSHTKLNLLSLAPMHYWHQRYPGKADPNWDMAIEEMMRACENIGVYDEDKVRGRGAWWDAGRPLLHVGSHVIVDGKISSLTDPSLEYIYEASKPLKINLDNPLTSREAFQFIQLCGSLQWEKPIFAKLLAGWVFLAPICGALTWRPHIWITGGGGTGKSFIMSNIIGKVLGNNSLRMQGSATEAGVRQQLRLDALPVVFDEAESKASSQSQERIQMIMELARQASSQSDGGIIKGSATGKSMIYRIRSMFCLSSIGVGVSQYADKTRFSILSLHIDETKTKEQREKHFEKLQADLIDLLTEDYCARLKARSIAMIPNIRANAEVFAKASARVIGTQRLGDQIGTLLAGAYCLQRNDIITPDEALKWVEAQDWREEAQIQDLKDELACLAHILEYVLRIGTVERSIGDLISISYGKRLGDEAVSENMAKDALLRHGIKVNEEGVKISNSHSAMANILRNTAWAKEWARILKRIEGAEPRDPERFGYGSPSRCVIIPFDAIEGR